MRIVQEEIKVIYKDLFIFLFKFKKKRLLLGKIKHEKAKYNIS